jgi:aminopeptidase N
VEEALQEALGPGFIIEEFEADWLTFIWERYGPPGTVPVITPAPRRSPTPAPTATPALTLPTAPLPLPVVEGIAAYQSTMRPGSEGEVAVIEGLPHYDLALQADFETETLSGRERLVFVNREHEALKDILLRLYPNCSQAGTMIVGGVSGDGQAVDFTYQAGDTAVLVSLPQPLSVGESIALEVDFAVRLHPQAEDVWSAAFFYPMLAVYQDGAWRKDAISSGPDAVFSESASYAVELTVHDTMMVAASGVKVNAVDNGDGTISHSYRGGPLRGFALFMSEDFQVSSETLDGIAVNTWYLPGEKEKGEDILEFATDAVEVFDERFGPYPYAELDVVVILDTRFPADMVTGVEYPTLVAVLHGGAGDPEFATVHEVAHQWWYGVVGNDVLQEPWLDESFANYSVVVYYEDIHGQEMAHEVYQERILALYEHVRDANQDGPVGRSIQDFSESQQPSGPIIYGKGAVFLDTLRQEASDEAFFAILQEYFRRYKYGVATGEGFWATVEEVVGGELNHLYDVWIRK